MRVLLITSPSPHDTFALIVVSGTGERSKNSRRHVGCGFLMRSL
jgi:hypothetical protein